MDAKKLDSLVVDYLYGELSPEQREAFEEALAEHPEVQRDLDNLRHTRSLVEDLEELEPPEEISRRLMQEAERLAPRPAREEGGFFARVRAVLSVMVLHPAMSAAATLVVVLGVSFYVYHRGAPPPATPQATSDLPAIAGRRAAQIRAAREAEQPAGSAREPDRQEARPAVKVASPPLAGGKGLAAQKTQAAGKMKANAAPGPAVARQIVGADRHDRTIASNAARLRASRRGRTQLQRKTALRRPKKRARRARVRRKAPKKASAELDQLLAAGGRRKAAKGGVKAPKRKARRGKKGGQGRARQRKARQALAAAQRAMAKGDCERAFGLWTTALRADGTLAGRVATAVGRCRAQLGRTKRHRWLAGRVRQEVARRAAKRAARARRAKRKPVNAKPANPRQNAPAAK